jgi:hypothetical protein
VSGEEVNPENWTCRNDSCWLQNVAGQCFLQIFFSSTMTKDSGNVEYKINRSNTHVHMFKKKIHMFTFTQEMCREMEV